MSTVGEEGSRNILEGKEQGWALQDVMETGIDSRWELRLCRKVEQKYVASLKCHTAQVRTSTLCLESGGTGQPWEMWQQGH